MGKIKYPDGVATRITATSSSNVTAPEEIFNTKTFLDLATTEATTINLDISTEIMDGSELEIEVSQGATGYNVALGTGFHTDAPALTGVLNDIDKIKLVYDASEGVFKADTAAWVKTHNAT